MCSALVQFHQQYLIQLLTANFNIRGTIYVRQHLKLYSDATNQYFCKGRNSKKQTGIRVTILILIQSIITIGFLGSGAGLTVSCFSGGYFLASMIGLARGSNRSGRFGVFMTSLFRKWSEQIRVLKQEINVGTFLLSRKIIKYKQRFVSLKSTKKTSFK